MPRGVGRVLKNLDQRPAEAVLWECWRLTRTHGKTEKGRAWANVRPEQLRTAPDPVTGIVADRWPVRELSAQTILQRWGAGRFRVVYISESSERVGSAEITVATPGEAAASQKLVAGEDVAPSAPTDRLRAVAGRLDGGGALEIMLLLQDAGDRAAERARIDAQAAAQRDRDFFERIMKLQPAQQPATAAAAGGMTAKEIELLKRELALEARENLAKAREELAAQLNEALAAQQQQQEPDDPPETAGEAISQAGIGIVQSLETQTPGIVNEAVGALRAWLRAKGHQVTPDVVNSLAEAVRAATLAEANGAHKG